MKHRIVTAAQMKEIEQAGDAHGLPYLQMMENAGLAAYAELQKQCLCACRRPAQRHHTDTGEVAEGAAHADLTVTFDSYKPLHIAETSALLCGKIVCADIGIRDEWHPEF